MSRPRKNKKFIDPRYFMDEKMEVIEEGFFGDMAAKAKGAVGGAAAKAKGALGWGGKGPTTADQRMVDEFEKWSGEGSPLALSLTGKGGQNLQAIGEAHIGDLELTGLIRQFHEEVDAWTEAASWGGPGADILKKLGIHGSGPKEQHLMVKGYLQSNHYNTKRKGSYDALMKALQIYDQFVDAGGKAIEAGEDYTAAVAPYEKPAMAAAAAVQKFFDPSKASAYVKAAGAQAKKVASAAAKRKGRAKMQQSRQKGWDDVGSDPTGTGFE